LVIVSIASPTAAVDVESLAAEAILEPADEALEEAAVEDERGKLVEQPQGRCWSLHIGESLARERL
jgi:hypothetical protein